MKTMTEKASGPEPELEAAVKLLKPEGMEPDEGIPVTGPDFGEPSEIDNLFQDIKPGVYGELLCLLCRKLQPNATSKPSRKLMMAEVQVRVRVTLEACFAALVNTQSV